MQNSFPNIALVLFTRTPEEEARAKRLLPQGRPAQQIGVAEKLIQNGRHTLAATGLPYFIYSSTEQKGKNFGERLQNVFAQLFSRGYEKVIVIGNDCPLLKPADVLRAAHQLQEQEVVVGPDNRGGVYLLGLTQQASSSTIFESTRWNSSWVLTDIAAACGVAPSEICLLEKYADLNNCRDFTKAVRQNFFCPGLLLFFRQLLSNLIPKYSPWESILFRFELVRSLSFRGPPFLN